MKDLSYTVEGLLPEPVVVSIKNELRISEDLDREVDTAARTFGYYAVIAEKAETRFQKMKMAFEIWQSETEVDIQRVNKGAGEKRPVSEAKMKALVRAESKYRSYQLKLIEYGEHTRILKAITKAFEIKASMVQTKAANRRGETRLASR